MQTLPIKTNYTGTSAVMFLCCAILASCSSGQNAFFVEKDALISQEYKWEKLNKCRPAIKDTPALPITVSEGRKLVCYKLVPPHGGAAAALLPAADDSQTALSNPTAATITPDASPATTPAQPADPPSDASGIIWNFSNF